MHSWWQDRPPLWIAWSGLVWCMRCMQFLQPHVWRTCFGPSITLAPFAMHDEIGKCQMCSQHLDSDVLTRNLPRASICQHKLTHNDLPNVFLREDFLFDKIRHLCTCCCDTDLTIPLYSQRTGRRSPIKNMRCGSVRHLWNQALCTGCGKNIRV